MEFLLLIGIVIFLFIICGGRISLGCYDDCCCDCDCCDDYEGDYEDEDDNDDEDGL